MTQKRAVKALFSLWSLRKWKMRFVEIKTKEEKILKRNQSMKNENRKKTKQKTNCTYFCNFGKEN